MSDEISLTPEEIERYKDLYLAALAAVLREERDHQGLKQYHIAERSGLTTATVSDLEGARNSRLTSLWQYCVLGLNLPFAVVCARAERRIEERRSAAQLPILPAYDIAV